MHSLTFTAADWKFVSELAEWLDLKKKKENFDQLNYCHYEFVINKKEVIFEIKIDQVLSLTKRTTFQI